MKSYVKLVNFEINRFIKIYVSLLIITLLSQLIGVIVTSRGLMKRAHEVMFEQNLSENAYLHKFGGFDFTHISSTLWFIGPIALCIVALIFYNFMIWYRDWFGKNTFAYRLLMLPTARISLYFSKATAILALIFGLLAFQMILLPLENVLFETFIPENFLKTSMDVSSILQSNFVLGIIFPPYFSDFLISYGIGMMFVFVLFTSILFERSFRLKGIVFGILYFIAAVLLFLSPLFAMANETVPDLYPGRDFCHFPNTRNLNNGSIHRNRKLADIKTGIGLRGGMAMKRYISSILLVCLSIIIIGAYYGIIIVNANDFPEYSINTVEGLESEIKDVSLRGFVEEEGISNNVKITLNETLYLSNQSYFQRMTGNNDPRIEKLKKEHRSFMRGKNNIYSFYQDADFIAYAETVYKPSSLDHSYKDVFNIGLLDLASDKEISFELGVPGGIFNSIGVLDVQLIQSQLKVVTENYMYGSDSNTDQEEIHLYTFDLANQKLLNDEVIITPQQIKMGYDIINSMEQNPSQPRNSIVFIKRPKVVNQGEGSANTTDKAAIFEYVYEKNHLETIELPETLTDRILTSRNYLNGDELYIINQDAKGMHLTTFNIANQSIINDQTFPINNVGTGEFPIVIKNDRVYVLATNDFEENNMTNLPPQLFIGELKTGKILYKGEVIPKKADQKFNTKSLVLYSLEIK